MPKITLRSRVLHKLDGPKITGAVVIIVLTLIGVHLFVASHAQSPYASAQAESGTLSGAATLSSSQYVQFGNLADPSGQNVPIGDEPGWHQVYYDNFADENVPLGSFSGCTTSGTGKCSGLPTTCTTANGDCPSLPTSGPQSKWWDYPDGWPDTAKENDGVGCEYMPSQTMSISGGIMNMFIHTASNGTCETAVPEPINPNSTDGKGGQLYGMYSVRMRSDPVPGYITAFLLWPDSQQWPENGEIDFPNNSLNSDAVQGFVHYENAVNGGQQAAITSPAASSSYFSTWHTYTIQWAPTYVKFLVDGVSIGEYADGAVANCPAAGESTCAVPDTPMYWVLQTENDIGTTLPDPSASGNLQVDWVSIWSYDPSAT
jgi:hypothetical protein